MKNAATFLIVLAFYLPAGLAIAAPGAVSHESEDRQILAAAIRGPAEVNLHDEAVLKLPAGTAFLPRAAAATLLARMNNAIRPGLAGLVMGGGNWMLVMEYHAEGHVSDEDVKSLEAAGLMRRMKMETPEDRRRRQQGLEVLRPSHWVFAPHYDSILHQLFWAVEYETVSNGAVVRKSINNNAVALGRVSRIDMGLVTESRDAKANAAILSALLAGLRFLPGHRYEDFKAGKDGQTSDGLAGLIAN